MDVLVTFDNGRWQVFPDPAVVPAGTPITWVLRSRQSPIARLVWTIYFNNGTPFRNLRVLRTTTLHTHLGTIVMTNEAVAKALKGAGVDPGDVADHQGARGPVNAEEPGEYKYGIRVQNAETGDTVGDDDPMLIVRRT